MKKYLVIDFNTTGFLKYKELSEATLDLFPYAVEVGASLYSEDGALITTIQTPRKLPAGVSCSSGAKDFHGLDGTVGLRGSDIFIMIKHIINECDAIVAHNIHFDLSILKAEFMRLGLSIEQINEKEHLCTMVLGSEICKLDSGVDGDYKYPKLSELYRHLGFGEMPLSNSVTNCIDATWKCFKGILDRG